MPQPRRALPAAPPRAQDETPTVSGEYRAVGPRSLPAAPPLEPPSGRYGTVPESRRVLDEYDFDIHAWGALELEDERRRRSLEPPPASSFKTPPRRTISSSSSIVAIDPHAMLVAYAGFGADPTSLWAMPRYALHARRRRHALLRELEIAKKHKPQEVGTIEAALRTMDTTAVRKGLVLLGVYVALGAAFLVAAASLVKALL